jgi:hypothetical protein
MAPPTGGTNLFATYFYSYRESKCRFGLGGPLTKLATAGLSSEICTFLDTSSTQAQTMTALAYRTEHPLSAWHPAPPIFTPSTSPISFVDGQVRERPTEWREKYTNNMFKTFYTYSTFTL